MVASEQYLYPTIVQFDKTIVLPIQVGSRKYTCYLFWFLPLVCILFEVLRILGTTNRIPTKGPVGHAYLLSWCYDGDDKLYYCFTLNVAVHATGVSDITIAQNDITMKTCNTTYT